AREQPQTSKSQSLRPTRAQRAGAVKQCHLAWHSRDCGTKVRPREYRSQTAFQPERHRPSSQLIETIDRLRGLSYSFLCRNSGEAFFHFLSRSKRPYFNERCAPAGELTDLYNRTPLQV